MSASISPTQVKEVGEQMGGGLLDHNVEIPVFDQPSSKEESEVRSTNRAVNNFLKLTPSYLALSARSKNAQQTNRPSNQRGEPKIDKEQL